MRRNEIERWTDVWLEYVIQVKWKDTLPCHRKENRFFCCCSFSKCYYDVWLSCRLRRTRIHKSNIDSVVVRMRALKPIRFPFSRHHLTIRVMCILCADWIDGGKIVCVCLKNIQIHRRQFASTHWNCWHEYFLSYNFFFLSLSLVLCLSESRLSQTDFAKYQIKLRALEQHIKHVWTAYNKLFSSFEPFQRRFLLKCQQSKKCSNISRLFPTSNLRLMDTDQSIKPYTRNTTSRCVRSVQCTSDIRAFATATSVICVRFRIAENECEEKSSFAWRLRVYGSRFWYAIRAHWSIVRHSCCCCCCWHCLHSSSSGSGSQKEWVANISHHIHTPQKHFIIINHISMKVFHSI